MFTSVIICTYNRARLLTRTLQALAHQSTAPDCFEVFVVDDGSVDDTARVCRDMGQKLPNLNYVSLGRNEGLGSAANLGIRSTSGDFVLFTDDDCIPGETWVERMHVALEQNPIVAGAISTPVSHYIKLCHNISQFHPFMPGRMAGTVAFVAGANMGFRRSVLEGLNGFQEGLRVPPDMEFILRARSTGYRIHFTPDAVVKHDPHRTGLTEVFQYASEHAFRTIVLRNRYRSLLHTPFVLRSWLLTLLAAPLIALKVTADIYMGNAQLARYLRTAPLVFWLKLAWCWGAARGLRNLKKGKTDA